MSVFDNLSAEASQGRISPPNDAEAEAAFPLMWELFTAAYSDHRVQRIYPTITLNRVSGGWRINLQEHDFGRQKILVVLKLADMFSAIEKALSDDSLAPWQEYASPKNRQGLKKFEVRSSAGTETVLPSNGRGGRKGR